MKRNNEEGRGKLGKDGIMDKREEAKMKWERRDDWREG